MAALMIRIIKIRIRIMLGSEWVGSMDPEEGEGEDQMGTHCCGDRVAVKSR